MLSPKHRAAVKRAAERVGMLGTLHTVRMRWRDARAVGAETDDLPPPKLRSLVGGSPDSGWFLTAGRRSAAALRAAAIERGFDLDDPATDILDFGCGCGRISRHWQRPIHGTDIQPELVAWCQEHLPGDYTVNDPEPPTHYPESAFDVVYAVSVFTHLPVDRQREWLAEFARIMRQGGLLLLTTHGDRLAAEALSRDELREYHDGRIVVCYPRHAGKNLCAAYHPAGSVARLTHDFDVVGHLVEALARHDIHALTRTPSGEDATRR